MIEGARGLVIDLRFNPGGVMQQAVAMVDRFIDEGVILATVTRQKAVREYEATHGGTIDDLALVVLINGGSASSSEIVAGSLQAFDRAIVVGERSFGKGSVQQLIHLSEHHAAIKLTTAYYRLPDGRFIHRMRTGSGSGTWGVIPDVEIVLDHDEVQAIQAARRALDLAFADYSLSSEDGDNPAATRSTEGPTTNQIILDRQLREALNQVQNSLQPRGT